MRLTDKYKIKELETLQKHKVLITYNDYKELKLGKLENIEEKLGIELTILFEALINGIWIKDKAKKCRPCYLSASLGSMQLTNAGIRYSTISTNKYLYFKDRGKTCALDKEEFYKNIK